MPILIDFPQGSDTAIRDYVNILARPGKGKSRLNTWDVITRVIACAPKPTAAWASNSPVGRWPCWTAASLSTSKWSKTIKGCSGRWR